LSTGTGLLKTLLLPFQSLLAIAVKNPAEAMDGDHFQRPNRNDHTSGQAEEQKTSKPRTYQTKAVRVNPGLAGIEVYSTSVAQTSRGLSRRHFFREHDTTLSGVEEQKASESKNRATHDRHNYVPKTIKNASKLGGTKLSQRKIGNRRISLETGGLHDSIKRVTALSLPPSLNKQNKDRALNPLEPLDRTISLGSISAATFSAEPQALQNQTANLSIIKGTGCATGLEDFLNKTNSPGARKHPHTGESLARKHPHTGESLALKRRGRWGTPTSRTPTLRYEHHIKENPLGLENPFNINATMLCLKHNIEKQPSHHAQESAYSPAGPLFQISPPLLASGGLKNLLNPQKNPFPKPVYRAPLSAEPILGATITQHPEQTLLTGGAGSETDLDLDSHQ